MNCEKCNALIDAENYVSVQKVDNGKLTLSFYCNPSEMLERETTEENIEETQNMRFWPDMPYFDVLDKEENTLVVGMQRPPRKEDMPKLCEATDKNGISICTAEATKWYPVSLATESGPEKVVWLCDYHFSGARN